MVLLCPAWPVSLPIFCNPLIFAPSSSQVKDFLAVGDAHRGVTFLRYNVSVAVHLGIYAELGW